MLSKTATSCTFCSMYRIRKALIQEYPLLLDIWEDAVSATHNFLSSADFDFFRSKLPEYFENVDLYVYEKDSDLKGFMGISSDNLEMLFVKDRGTGIGKTLLDYAIRVLSIQKVDVNEQNTKALCFYKNNGFVPNKRSELDGCGKPYPIIHMIFND